MSEHKIDIKPLTKEDAIAFYGNPLQKSVLAWGIWQDGIIKAVSGITISREHAEFFSDIAPDVKVPAITVMRVSKQIVELVKARGFFPIAMTRASDKYLQKLGFFYLGEYKEHGVYKL